MAGVPGRVRIRARVLGAAAPFVKSYNCASFASIWSEVWIALEFISYARWVWIMVTSSCTTLTFEPSR
ncbi:hypothetical protein D3C71_2073310 [compost metagenome]